MGKTMTERQSEESQTLTRWALAKGWQKKYGVRPNDFPENPWVLYSPDEPMHLYLNKSESSSPPEKRWYSYEICYADKKPSLEPKITCEVIGPGSVRIVDSRPSRKAKRAGCADVTDQVPVTRSTTLPSADNLIVDDESGFVS